jgi:hypothetical protein
MIDPDEVRALAESLRAAEDSLAAAKRVHEHAASRLAQAICPHRLGDCIEIKGESYNGKTGLVKSIKVVPYLGRYEWQVQLVVLKDNGQESAHRTQVRQSTRS